ncbi:Family of serine hydrolases 3 [Diatrype stigma]|uniref:Family of serine hydrolases 3 n=1 Tax=Diatrype stigma TaxID=117547 RepID=A0AAN9V0F2_9PEZI
MSSANQEPSQPGPKGPANSKKAKAAAAIPNDKKELKILMLHGYTQSGPLFDSKTRALAKLLNKALGPAPLNLAPRMIFPTGPHRLRAQDIPGFEPPAAGEEGGEEEDESDNWGWWRKDEASGAYAGFGAAMRTVAAAIRDARGGEGTGGIDGVLGFSQGGCLAALVAAVLETPYRAPPPGCPSPEPTGAGAGAQLEYDWSWIEELRAANGHQPLRFCVVYSGFWAPVAGLQWLYGEGEEKKISTPTLHFLGSLDSVVEESRSQALIDRCRDPAVAVHSGGHHVPVARDRVMPLVGFLRQVLEKEKQQQEEREQEGERL